jgi:hypothetical protein
MPDISLDIKNEKLIQYYTSWFKKCAVYGNTKKDIKIYPATFIDSYPYSIVKLDNDTIRVKISYKEEIVETIN